VDNFASVRVRGTSVRQRRTRANRRRNREGYIMSTRLGISIAILALLLGCSSGGPNPTPGSTSTGPPAATTTTTTATTGPGSTAATTGPATNRHAGLVPLWPFTSTGQVAAWQAGYRSGGLQPWHLDVERTALSFTRDHLGYTEIDRVTTRSVSGDDAHLGVGSISENGKPHTAAVLHLIRFGTEQDAPWVVVGTDDTDLTLQVPRYGSAIGSPLTVGGLISGVDESLRVVILPADSATPLMVRAGLPAGGIKQPWSTSLTFAAPQGAVLTVAVSTGGHLAAVERFAVTAVTVR
jgi:hypothetical protein